MHAYDWLVINRHIVMLCTRIPTLTKCSPVPGWTPAKPSRPWYDTGTTIVTWLSGSLEYLKVNPIRFNVQIFKIGTASATYLSVLPLVLWQSEVRDYKSENGIWVIHAKETWQRPGNEFMMVTVKRLKWRQFPLTVMNCF